MPRIRDGFSTTVSFSLDVSLGGLEFWEKGVTPPGYDGGGMIDVTSMRNEEFRTRISKQLITLTEFTITIAWDPDLYSSIFDMLNQNQSIGVFLPDGSSISFRGWINSFVPNEHREGEEPTAALNIIPSNLASDGVTEEAPVYTPA